jgi:nucleoside-diphosphate kinase
MSGNITFTMIKPEAIIDSNIGAITEKIESAGFGIIAMKMTRLTQERARAFYMVHKDRPFYDSLCEYMSSGKIIALVLAKDNAVEDYR